MDSFRESRIRNYRVKSDAGFTCQFDGCEADWGLLVVHVRSHVEARCKLHRKNLEPTVGQWDSRPPYTPMADPISAPATQTRPGA